MNPILRFSRNSDDNQVRRPWSVDSGRRRSGRSQHPLLWKPSEKPHKRANLLTIERLIATQRSASPVSGTLSWSLLILRFWPVHEKLRSTTHLLGKTMKSFR